MAEVHQKQGQSFESMLKAFKIKLAREGTLREVRERQFYRKPSEKRRRRRRM